MVLIMSIRNKKISKKQVVSNQSQMENENLKGTKAIDRAIAWLFIAAIGILPLLVRVKLIQFVAPKMIQDLFDTGILSEAFTYYKWIFLLCLTTAAIGLLLYKMVVYEYKIKRSYINLPLLILAFTTLLSGVLAEYLSISLFGMYNRHEGTITFLCYLALFFVAANTRFDERFSRNVVTAICILVSINVVIILFDFFGRDLIKNQFVRLLILPRSLPESALGGHINSTLFNPNYISGFAGSIAAFFLTAAMLEKDLIKKLIHSVFTIISFAMLLASLSASGFVTLVVIIPVILALALINPGRLQSLATGVAVLAACAAVFLVLNSHNPRVWKETVGSFGIFTVGIEKEISLQPINWLERLLQPEQAQAATTDTVKVTTESDKDQFNLPKPSSSAGTGRTYIWKETLKLIKQRPVLGYGHDTLIYYFPQNDRNKIANLGTYDVIVSKPHNFYLDLAYSSGIPALLAFMALVILYLFYTAREKIKAAGHGPAAFPTALFVFTCAFLLQWLFNDSVIGTSVIFWSLLGISVSYTSN